MSADATAEPTLVGVVVLPEEVDLAVAPELRDLLLSSLNRGAVHLIADATRTTFMDSSGINALVRARDRAERLGGSLHVATQTRAVRRVLELTGLTRVVGVVASVAEARCCITDPVPGHYCSNVAE